LLTWGTCDSWDNELVTADLTSYPATSHRAGTLQPATGNKTKAM
jgi:hypothetical protein